jgi:hypothetical protein
MEGDDFNMGAGLECSIEGDDGLEDLYKGDPVQSFGGDFEGSMDFNHELPIESLDPESPMGPMNLPPVEDDPQTGGTAGTGGMNAAQPPDMKVVLGRVENFILPAQDKRAAWYRGITMPSNAHGNGADPLKSSLSPDTRFRDVLLQVAIADHIRIFQTMYRDNNDELMLFSELRGGDDDEDDPTGGFGTMSNTIKKVPTLEIKALQTKIIEGRVRANALCRLCHGEESLEMLKGVIDLASAYALQGMWPQVSEHMAIAAQKLVSVVDKNKKAAQVEVILRARDAAARVECVYKVLREHAVANRGQVKKEVLETLVVALGELPRHYSSMGGGKNSDDADDPLKYPTQLVALLHGFMVRHAAKALDDHLARAQNFAKTGSAAGLTGDISDGLIAQAFADMELETNKPMMGGLDVGGSTTPDADGNMSITIPLPSWGEVVTFLREDCLLMRSWMDDIEAGLMPQARAALFLPFKQSDSNHRGAVHPAQLHYNMQRSPSAIKALVGTTALKKLQTMDIKMPLQINPQAGEVKQIRMHVLAYAGTQPPGPGGHGNTGTGGIDTAEEWARVSAPNSPSPGNAGGGRNSIRAIMTSKGGGRNTIMSGTNKASVNMSSAEYIHDEFTTPTQTVLYELPVLWEEVQAMVMGECIDDVADVLRAQVVTLLGVVHMFGDKLDSAEESMGDALKILSRIGLEQEVASCELYNSIAQMMIIKYRTWNGRRKERAKKETARWMASEKGRTAVKREVETARRLYLERQANEQDDLLVDFKEQVLSREVREAITTRAKESVAKRYMREFAEKEVDPTKMAVEAATRYLVRSYEIISEAHGAYHPSSGTACLAVASVHSVGGVWEQSREWLVRALRCFERVEPKPVRTIAFTQHQLSTALAKMDFHDECMRVLDKAANFHLEKARAGLADHAKDQRESGYSVFTPVLKGSPLYEDVVLAMNMTSKISRMVSKKGGKWQAAEQSEIVAELADAAFGWDSVTAGEAFKEVGSRYAAISDWQRSASAFKKAQHAFEAVFGKEDRKAISCAKNFLKAEDRKNAGIKQADEMMRSGMGAGTSHDNAGVVEEGDGMGMDMGMGGVEDSLGEEIAANSDGDNSELTEDPSSP